MIMSCDKNMVVWFACMNWSSKMAQGGHRGSTVVGDEVIMCECNSEGIK